MSIHGVLGESTSYPTTYQPDTLYAIPRSKGRNEINWQSNQLEQGVDWWHAFEVSWLNNQGVTQVAIARFTIPASSTNIVESKSLKLYLNSLNFTKFASWEAVEQTIASDLSACVEGAVEVDLFHPDTISKDDQHHSGFLIAHPQGECIDDALDDTDIEVELVAHPDANLLKSHDDNVGSEVIEYKWYSNLLRSNCPVTNQPDWGTLGIKMTSKSTIDKASLLAYILSYRQHNGFHEQCVEQIFSDLTQKYNPETLIVRAWYTRRGGIDINPCRVSDMNLLPLPSRLVRQ